MDNGVHFSRYWAVQRLEPWLTIGLFLFVVAGASFAWTRLSRLDEVVHNVIATEQIEVEYLEEEWKSGGRIIRVRTCRKQTGGEFTEDEDAFEERHDARVTKRLITKPEDPKK